MQIREGIHLSQSVGLSSHIFFNIDFKVPLNFSTRPLHIAWYREVVNLRIERSLLTSFMTPDTNCDPWSVNTSCGKPNLEYIL